MKRFPILPQHAILQIKSGTGILTVSNTEVVILLNGGIRKVFDPRLEPSAEAVWAFTEFILGYGVSPSKSVTVENLVKWGMEGVHNAAKELLYSKINYN